MAKIVLALSYLSTYKIQKMFLINLKIVLDSLEQEQFLGLSRTIFSAIKNNF